MEPNFFLTTFSYLKFPWSITKLLTGLKNSFSFSCLNEHGGKNSKLSEHYCAVIFKMFCFHFYLVPRNATMIPDYNLIHDKSGDEFMSLLNTHSVSYSEANNFKFIVRIHKLCI